MDGEGGGGWAKRLPSPKTCDTYPMMIKLGMVMPYLKKIQKYINHETQLLRSTEIRIFSLEINKFSYIKKYKYVLHVDA